MVQIAEAKPRFRKVVCFACGGITYNAKLMTARRRRPQLRLLCAECGRETNVIVKAFGSN